MYWKDTLKNSSKEGHLQSNLIHDVMSNLGSQYKDNDDVKSSLIESI